MGGSDQWGNIVTGIDLGRRMGTHQLYALTTPLLTTSSGAKMGKSVAGAVWLNEDMLGAYDYWQFWRNTEDADVGRFLKLFTTLPLAEIARLAALQGAEINEAKKVLATEATAMLHGRDKAEAAAADGAADVRAGHPGAGTADGGDRGGRAGGRPRRAHRVREGRAWSSPTARRAARSPAAACASTTRPWRTRRRSSRPPMSRDGVVKLSLGKKRHVLLKPV